MAEDILTNTGVATIAYRDALTRAQNTQNALLRQYGFTAPNATGEYTVEAAQQAFDPNTLFDKATGGINQANLQALQGRIQTGTTGVLAGIQQAGAGSEAEAVLGARAAGVTGGLAEQRRRLAETQTEAQLGGARQEFIAGLAEAQAPIAGAFSQLEQARILDRLMAERAGAYRDTVPGLVEPEMEEPVAPSAPSVVAPKQRAKFTKSGTPGGEAPQNPVPGQEYAGPGGVMWVYRPAGPKGKGWYRKPK
jgi:hypothetical protein